MMMLLMVGFVAAGSVSRDVPGTVAPGETLTVTFTATDMEVGKVLAIEDMIPANLAIKEWSVEGSEEAKADIEYVVKDADGKNRHSWSFTATTTSPKLTYKIDVPASMNGALVLDAVYVMPPAKIDNLKSTVNVQTPAPAAAPVAAPTPEPVAAPAPTPEPVAAPDAPAPEEKKGMLPAILAVIFLVVVIGVFIWMKQKKQPY